MTVQHGKKGGWGEGAAQPKKAGGWGGGGGGQPPSFANTMLARWVWKGFNAAQIQADSGVFRDLMHVFEHFNVFVQALFFISSCCFPCLSALISMFHCLCVSFLHFLVGIFIG